MSRIELLHGSDHVIEKPDFSLGKTHNDYGRGFYCTRELPKRQLAAKILACAKISTTPIVKPIAVFFIIIINELPSAGNAAINACGSIISLYMLTGLNPIDKAASLCPLSTDSKPPLMISAINAAEFIAIVITRAVLPTIFFITGNSCGNPK